jgi:hypothetical protein
VAAYAVALIYALYRTHQKALGRRQRLRERGAYMLWVMAERLDGESSLLAP